MWQKRSNLCIVFVKMKCETSRSSLSIPSSSRTFQKFIVHWYKRVHIPAYLRFGSKHFSKSNCVLERVCVRAALEKILTVLGDVVGWRQHTCSSRNAAHLAFSFPMPLTALCSQGQKQSFTGLLNVFPGMWLGKKSVNQKRCEIRHCTAWLKTEPKPKPERFQPEVLLPLLYKSCARSLSSIWALQICSGTRYREAAMLLMAWR